MRNANRMVSVWGVVGAIWVCGVGARAASGVQAGAAKADITPDVQVNQTPLGGYAARRAAPSTGVHDHVYAHALVLSDGKTTFGIVSVDLCFLPANIKTEVAQRVHQAIPTFDPQHLFLSATHTHSAPDPLAMHRGNSYTYKGWTRFDSKLLDFTVARIADAVIEADKHLGAANIGWGTFDATGWNRNRRGGTLTDPIMTLVKVTDDTGRPLAAIVNFAAHPTLFGDAMREISADWPGVMAAQIEQTLGNNAVCLFLNGAEGDATVNQATGDTEAARVDTYGHKIAEIALAQLATLQPQPTKPLAMWNTVVTLPKRKPNGMFLVAAAQMGASILQAKELVRGLMPEQTQITFCALGPMVLMGFPCEPTAAIGLAAKDAARKAGFTVPGVVALTNDWLGYALTPEEYAQGNYEASMSFYGDQFGPTLLDAVKQGLHAVPHE